MQILYSVTEADVEEVIRERFPDHVSPDMEELKPKIQKGFDAHRDRIIEAVLEWHYQEDERAEEELESYRRCRERISKLFGKQ